MIATIHRLLISLFLLLSSQHLQATTLDRFSVAHPTKNSALLTFFFSKTPNYHQFILSNPSRIVFDFSDLSVKSSLKKLSSQTDFIKTVRFARRGKNNMRLVLDVLPGTTLSTKKINSAKGAELLLTLSQVAQKGAAKVENLPSVLLPFLKEEEARARVKMNVVHRDVVVVIDPGHGGKDPGAMGARRTQEKRVVLQIAKKLKAMVDRQPGMTAHLTRRGDYYVGLRKRLALAREYKADIFISIHADAFLNRRSRGASVYSLSQRGATSEAARWIAASENHSELGGVDLSDLDDDNGMVRSVLIDLSQTATISASLTLGQKVLSDLNTIAKLHHDDVEQARFVVLKSPDIPSILVETGFISNSSEERLLASGGYQRKLANSILKGLTHYFKEHPPRDSAMAHRSQTYRVVRGDTLSGIAHKFKISMVSLKQSNKLNSARLSIGQTLEVYF